MAYATSDDLTAFAATDEADAVLAAASLDIDMLLFSTIYPTDDDGNPTEAATIAAMNSATLYQAQFLIERGDYLGTTKNYNTITEGSVKVQKAQSGTEIPQNDYSKYAVQILANANLLNSQPFGW